MPRADNSSSFILFLCSLLILNLYRHVYPTVIVHPEYVYTIFIKLITCNNFFYHFSHNPFPFI